MTVLQADAIIPNIVGPTMLGDPFARNKTFDRL